MQHIPFTARNIAQAFNSLLAHQPLLHPDYTFKHECYFDGYATLYRIMCVCRAEDKTLWQAWRIHGGVWSEARLNHVVRNKMFNKEELTSDGDIVLYDPQLVVQSRRSPIGDIFKSSNVYIPDQPMRPITNGFNQGGQLGGMIQQFGVQPQIGTPQWGTGYPRHPNFFGPNDFPQSPAPGFNPQHQPRMDQVNTARSGIFTYDPKMVAKQLRGSLLTADGMIELNRLVHALNRELVTPTKWVINEDNTDVVNTFYGDPIFSSAADRIIAFKMLLDIPVSQGFVIVASDINEFTITVRLP